MNAWGLSISSKPVRALLLLVALAGLALQHEDASAAPCGGLTDVDSNVPAMAPFCASIEWVKNRQVTLGCDPAGTLYCPYTPVSRLAMAAFMNRLGTALTPVQVARDDAPGAIDLDVSPVVCVTDDFTVANFPRTAYSDASFSATAPADVTFAADLVLSTDAGATWTNLNTNPNRGSALAAGWGNAADVGSRELSVGQVARFGIRMTRGGVASGIDITDSRCVLRVLIYSRTGSTSPL
jgi:hypothetical protein